ncbi:MAG TPA: hypothetical protein ENH01_01090, partial [Nitrospirae bacterium]|nr:hypothetical protein [Nitrospirota bacterium]
SFVITITDGEPTTDLNIPLAQQGYGSTYADTSANPPAWAAASTDYFWQLNGSHYIDNVAFYGHADIDSLPAKYRDLRDGSIGTGAVLDGEQYLTHYFIYANFGSGSPDGERLLNWSAASGGGAARNGGFIDSNGDFKPDQQSEYDTDGDGNNDNFFDAKDGYQLEAALISAIYDAISHASSGTAAGMVANTADGEGAIYQAYFYPGKPEGAETRKWLGNITALFVDRNGNLREDNGNDGVLDSGDNIIKMSYSSSNGTEIYKCTYDNETLNLFTCPSTPETDGLDSINPLWDGGKSLWESATANRTIFTTVNGSTTLDFKIANSSTLKPYLRADSTSEADNIIDWIRGDDLTGITDSNHPDGYRKRDLTINGVNNVWKLGDIIHSSPTVVGKPMENYDLLYGDSSYTAFRSKYLKRRQVVYAGANDGMLHAFNAGCYDAAASKYYTDVNSSGNCVSSTTSGTTPLGKELWAFVPRGLLPHLKWLTDPGYTHVYYVDLKPKITDVKIFTDDTTHINGWGTILIGGFRYGGKDITCPAPCNSASPEYFALDITDPLNPKLLWTFSNPALGLSMAYPSVAKIGSEWYAIFASGATDYDAISDLTSFQGGNIFVLKISGGTDGVISDWTENMNFWKISTYETALNNNLTFMADPITVDVDIDYDVDVIYFGENYVQGSTWNTLLRRITTNKGAQTDPLLWKLSTVGNINTIAGSKDVVKRITAAPALAMDDSANLWVFFGTGQFLGASDKNQSDTGAFYALRDGCWAGGSGCTTSYTNLMDISTAIVNKDGTVSGISSTCGGTVSSWLDISTASYSCDGWVMYFGSLGEQADFTGANLTHTGERVSTKPLVLGGLVIWATYIPEDSLCSTEGESNLYAVYYKTGTAYSDYIFSKQRDIANAIAAADAAAVAATKAGDTAAADAAAVEAAALRNSYDTDKVARVKKLGGKIGMPSTLSAGVTTSGTVKGFAGQSTGSIVEIEVDSPISLKSEIMNWANRPIP